MDWCISDPMDKLEAVSEAIRSVIPTVREDLGHEIVRNQPFIIREPLIRYKDKKLDISIEVHFLRFLAWARPFISVFVCRFSNLCIVHQNF